MKLNGNNILVDTPVMSFRAERSVAKNLVYINVDVPEILPPYGRLNDNFVLMVYSSQLNRFLKN